MRRSKNTAGFVLRALILIIMLLLVVFPIISVRADTTDGWDTATTGFAGSVNLSPWVFSTDNSNCWSGITNPPLPDTGVSSQPNSLQPLVDATTSPTKAFEFNFKPSCSTLATSAAITTTVNASSTAIFVKWYQAMLSVCVATSACTAPAANTKNTLPANVVTFTLSIDGNTLYSNDTSSMKVCFCWNKISSLAGIPVTQGTLHTVQFKVATTPYGGGTYSFSFSIDTITFRNANVVLPNNQGQTMTVGGQSVGYNFVMYDVAKATWFNISAFAASQIRLNYTQPQTCTLGSGQNQFNIGTGEPPPLLSRLSSNLCVVYGVGYPDLWIGGLANVNLLTVYVGTNYQSSIIPCLDPLNHIFTVDTTSCGITKPVRVYLESPSFVLRYTIQVNDLSGQFTSFGGTKIFIYEGGVLVESGYLDSQSQFQAALVPGDYKVYLINSLGNEYITTISAGAASSTINIPIPAISFTAAAPLNVMSINGGLTCDSTGVIATYTDSLGLTSKVTIKLMVYNVTGLHPYLSTTQNMVVGSTSLTYTFTNIKTSIALQYILMANATRTDGSRPSLGPSPISSTPSGCNNLPPFFPVTPAFSPNVLGLNMILPTPAAWLNLLSLFIIFMTAALFGARAAARGTIFVIAETIIFAGAGWIPLPTFYASMFMIGAITTYLIQKYRRKY